MRTFISTLVMIAIACLPAWARHATQVTNVEHFVSQDRVQIVVHLDGAANYVEGTATEPYRVFFDIQGTQPAAALVSRTIVRDPVLQRIRVGQYQPGVTRVVLDLSGRTPYRASLLSNPPRLMIEIMRPLNGSPLPEQGAGVLSARARAPGRIRASLHAEPVLTPEQRPPSAPEVTYMNGQLTITATNCTLNDVLQAVALRAGISVDAPANLTSERVAARLGPASPRSVLSELLSGSDFDYIMVGDDQDPERVRSVVLSTDPSRGSAPAVAVAAPPEPLEEEVHPVEQAEQSPVAPPVQPQAMPADSASAVPQNRTPEQLLQELRQQQERELSDSQRQ